MKGFIGIAAAIGLLMIAASLISHQPEQSNEFRVQQDALGNIIRGAHYEIAGMPYYTKGRWVIHARVPDCKAEVVLGGEVAPQEQPPTTHYVLEVGGKSIDYMTEAGISSENLRSNASINPYLSC